MAEERMSPGLRQRFAAQPLWVRVAAFSALIIVLALVSKWLILLLLFLLLACGVVTGTDWMQIGF